MTTTQLETDLTDVDAPISDETWNAFISARKAHVDALETLAQDAEAHDSIRYDGEHFAPDGSAAATTKKTDIDKILQELETTAPLGTKQAKIIASEGKQLHDAVHGVKDRLHNLVNGLKDKKELPGTAEWKRVCETECARECHMVTQPIKAVFGKIEDLGIRYPQARGFLITVMNAFHSFADLVVNFINSVIAWVKNTIQTIWNAIKTAATWVWDKITRAANAVKSFFQHLF